MFNGQKKILSGEECDKPDKDDDMTTASIPLASSARSVSRFGEFPDHRVIEGVL